MTRRQRLARNRGSLAPLSTNRLHSARQTHIRNSNDGLKNGDGKAMTRPSEFTRERIMKAAERLFAESGYDNTSIRAIVAKAKVNQAAINYHFDGKDGLYREVLREAFRGLTEHQLTHAEELKSMPRDEAIAEFIRRQLQPLLGRDEYSRHMRIFNWETVQPTAVFRSLVAEEAAPFFGLAADLVRRFLPDADQRTLVVAAVWLLGQCSVFVRNREQLAQPPVGLVLDESAVDWLSGTISHWIVVGLDSASRDQAAERL
jgi:AcrR family transcriptional regulator